MTEGKPSDNEPVTSSQGPSPPPDETVTGPQIPTSIPTVPDRTELLSRARGFLQSPQIIHQDVAAKRQFLVEKGLNEIEIDGLLRELPVQRPSIPPRSYPQPPPSHLPNLLLGITRVFSWIAGGSAALIFLYYRFLLPRITQTALARRSIRAHHLSLLGRLNESLESLKTSQTEAYSALPAPDATQEAPNFQACHAIADILTVVGEKDSDGHNIPPVTLLRCALEDFGKGKEGDESQPTTEDLFRYIEGQLPWLVSEEGQQYEETLWETLSTCSLFSGTSSTADDPENQKPTRWTYIAPAPTEPSSVVKSLKQLTTSLPKSSEPKQNSRQHTLSALSDFTGYISTQMYMPYQAPSSAAGFLNGAGSSGPAEEEFRREIRALKGLVLNRRSFMTSSPRPNLPTP